MSTRRKLGYTALTAFAVFCFSRAVSYWSWADDPTESLPAIATVFDVPVGVWSFVWIAATVATVAGMIGRPHAWGYVPVMIMGLFWATGYLWLIPGDDTLRVIANAALYLVMTVLAWIGVMITHRRGLI